MVKTQKQLEKSLNKRKITLVGKFTYLTKHVDLKCQICKHLWSATPRKLTCDFYIPDVQLWIEVSGIQTRVYKTRLQKKIKWVEELKENFLFVRTPEQLRKILHGTV